MSIERLALSPEQQWLMYYFQYLKTQDDVANESNPKNKKIKRIWLDEWAESITNAFNIQMAVNGNKKCFPKYPGPSNFREEVKREFDYNPTNTNWYYLIILETVTFVPYFPLCNIEAEEFKDEKAVLRGLRCKSNSTYVYNIVKDQGYIKPDYVNRFEKVFTKTIMRLKGQGNIIFVAIAGTVVFAAILLGVGALLAPVIAPILVGSEFIGLSGAALTSACLAYIGGGAIAAGGGGMLAGTFVIAGGGSIIALATGGTLAGSIAAAVLSIPNYTLLQIAKFEVAIKEIILNAQHDTKTAQDIMLQFADKIAEYDKELAIAKLLEKGNSEKIKNIEISLDYMRKVQNELTKFLSSFKIGESIN